MRSQMGCAHPTGLSQQPQLDRERLTRSRAVTELSHIAKTSEQLNQNIEAVVRHLEDNEDNAHYCRIGSCGWYCYGSGTTTEYLYDPECRNNNGRDTPEPNDDF